MPAYTMLGHGLDFTSPGDLRGRGSCEARGSGSVGSSEGMLTGSKIWKVLRGVTVDLTRDLTQEIRAKLSRWEMAAPENCQPCS